MKKIIFAILLAVLFAGCSHYDLSTGLAFKTPNANILPTGFVHHADAGNGWHIYSSPIGYFMVSVQGVGSSGSFVEMTYLGRELGK